MSRQQRRFSHQAERLPIYLDALAQAAGHADRVVPIKNYTQDLMLPIERKSVAPMAARLAPGNVSRIHQSLHHIVADAAWGDDALLKQVRSQVLPAMTLATATTTTFVKGLYPWGFPTRLASSPRPPFGLRASYR